MSKFLAVVFGALTLSIPGFALDSEKFALHLRKALSLDTRTEIKVDPVVSPAGFGNLNVVKATLGGAPYQIFITKDEKQYFWGYSIDATVDPDQQNQSKTSLKDIHFKGSDKAPITIVEFSDLQCGHCKSAHEGLNTELYKAYTADQVRLVFKHFPLNGHDWAEPAAAASECASKQKESLFWDMTNYFFTNQASTTKDNIKEKTALAVTQFALDKKKFDQCMEAGAALEKVKADKKEGMALGVSSTPTLFINGRTRRGFRDFNDIKVVIEEKLKDIKK